MRLLRSRSRSLTAEHSRTKKPATPSPTRPSTNPLSRPPPIITSIPVSKYSLYLSTTSLSHVLLPIATRHLHPGDLFLAPKLPMLSFRDRETARLFLKTGELSSRNIASNDIYVSANIIGNVVAAPLGNTTRASLILSTHAVARNSRACKGMIIS